MTGCWASPRTHSPWGPETAAPGGAERWGHISHLSTKTWAPRGLPSPLLLALMPLHLRGTSDAPQAGQALLPTSQLGSRRTEAQRFLSLGFSLRSAWHQPLPSLPPWQGRPLPHRPHCLLSGPQQHRPGCRVGGERKGHESVGLGWTGNPWSSGAAPSVSWVPRAVPNCSVRAGRAPVQDTRLQSPPTSSQRQVVPGTDRETSSGVGDPRRPPSLSPASPLPGAAPRAHLFFSSELKSRTPASSPLSLRRRTPVKTPRSSQRGLGARKAGVGWSEREGHWPVGVLCPSQTPGSVRGASRAGGGVPGPTATSSQAPVGIRPSSSPAQGACSPPRPSTSALSPHMTPSLPTDSTPNPDPKAGLPRP